MILRVLTSRIEPLESDGLSYVEGEVINVVGRSSETIGIYSKTCGITYAKASACDRA
jgi:hypothetical protein